MSNHKQGRATHNESIIVLLANIRHLKKELCEVKIPSTMSLSVGVRDRLLFRQFIGTLAGIKSPLCVSILLLGLPWHGSSIV